MTAVSKIFLLSCFSYEELYIIYSILLLRSMYYRFSDLLHHLEQQMEERNCPDFLTHNIYLTRGWDANFARTVALHEEEQVDVVTGKFIFEKDIQIHSIVKAILG